MANPHVTYYSDDDPKDYNTMYDNLPENGENESEESEWGIVVNDAVSTNSSLAYFTRLLFV